MGSTCVCRSCRSRCSRYAREELYLSYTGVQTICVLGPQYPSLCNQYFKLVSFLCEAYAAKVAVQDSKLLGMLGASLRLGLQGFGTTVAKYALEAMASLAGYGNECARRAQPLSAEFERLCTQLLHGVFEAVLVDKFDSALMDPAAEAFFPLICLLQVHTRLPTNLGIPVLTPLPPPRASTPAWWKWSSPPRRATPSGTNAWSRPSTPCSQPTALPPPCLTKTHRASKLTCASSS